MAVYADNTQIYMSFCSERTLHSCRSINNNLLIYNVVLAHNLNQTKTPNKTENRLSQIVLCAADLTHIFVPLSTGFKGMNCFNDALEFSHELIYTLKTGIRPSFLEGWNILRKNGFDILVAIYSTVIEFLNLRLALFCSSVIISMKQKEERNYFHNFSYNLQRGLTHARTALIYLTYNYHPTDMAYFSLSQYLNILITVISEEVNENSHLEVEQNNQNWESDCDNDRQQNKNYFYDDEVYGQIQDAESLEVALIPPDDGSDQDDVASDDDIVPNIRDLGKCILSQKVDIEVQSSKEIHACDESWYTKR
nr:unnamed protein product [Callosobruchus analis]